MQSTHESNERREGMNAMNVIGARCKTWMGLERCSDELNKKIHYDTIREEAD